jgi:hypothetical protein
MSISTITGQELTPALATHQQAAVWDWKDLAQKLYAYDRLLRDWFALDLPPFVIRFDRLRPSRLGHFRPGCNEFAIAGEIAINIRYVDVLPFYETIGTLHHEQLHLWQHVHGRPGKGNYHNREYQQKAADSGLVVDSRGHTQYDPDGRFVAFLREHGIDIPALPVVFETTRFTGTSKLKKWSCSCTSVWAAVPDVAASCLRCGQAFSQQTSVIRRRPR